MKGQGFLTTLLLTFSVLTTSASGQSTANYDASKMDVSSRLLSGLQ